MFACHFFVIDIQAVEVEWTVIM